MDLRAGAAGSSLLSGGEWSPSKLVKAYRAFRNGTHAITSGVCARSSDSSFSVTLTSVIDWDDLCLQDL